MGTEHPKKVGDYVTLQRGTTYSGKLVGRPGPALLGLGSIEPGGGFRADFKTYGGDCPASLMLVSGDIYVALKGATKDASMVGSVARLPPTVPSGRLTQDTARLDFIDRRAEVVNHVYWILRTPQYRRYCDERVTGSASASFSRQDFLSYPVPPITKTSTTIVNVLQSTEAKIDLNQRLNETLEALARALFKSWFVDFDPVRAKVESKDSGLAQPLVDLFPDTFEDSEGAEIPQGWKMERLGDLAALNPESWSKDTRPAAVNYVDLSNTKWGRIEAVTVHRKTDAPSRAQRVLRVRDTIVGTVRPGNGSYAFVSEDGLTGSTGFAVLRPTRDEYAEFVYLAATSPENIDTLSHLADGGAYPAVRPEVVAATDVARPRDEVLKPFSRLVAPLFTKVAENERESSTLAALRDTLLPKLTSGELGISDTERFIGKQTE